MLCFQVRKNRDMVWEQASADRRNMPDANLAVQQGEAGLSNMEEALTHLQALAQEGEGQNSLSAEKSEKLKQEAEERFAQEEPEGANEPRVRKHHVSKKEKITNLWLQRQEQRFMKEVSLFSFTWL